MIRRTRRGFTLLEMMMVVVIIGILAALGVGGMFQMARTARVTGNSGMLTRMLVDARVRTMSQHCAHFVQINGRVYSPGTPVARAPNFPATMSLVRKFDCTRTNYFFEPGTDATNADRIVYSTELGDKGAFNSGLHLYFTAPTGVVTADELTDYAVAIGYLPNGTRSFAVDNGAGFAINGAGASYLLRFATELTDPGATVTIPTTGVATR